MAYTMEMSECFPVKLRICSKGTSSKSCQIDNAEPNGLLTTVKTLDQDRINKLM